MTGPLPLDSNLFDAQHYPPFEQLGRGKPSFSAATALRVAIEIAEENALPFLWFLQLVKIYSLLR